jgi:hypothetical protein
MSSILKIAVSCVLFKCFCCFMFHLWKIFTCSYLCMGYVEPQASCLLSKYSTTWAALLTLEEYFKFCFLFLLLLHCNQRILFVIFLLWKFMLPLWFNWWPISMNVSCLLEKKIYSWLQIHIYEFQFIVDVGKVFSSNTYYFLFTWSPLSWEWCIKFSYHSFFNLFLLPLL